MLKKFSSSKIPTKTGVFDFTVFRDDITGKETIVLSVGNVERKSDVFVRVHSQCVTSEIFGSLKCDCQQQLELALEEIQIRGEGLLIYLDQEGRGIGIGNKIAAYNLQSQGMDTVEANLALGFDDDLREYSEAIEILRHFQIVSLHLNTNNPHKLSALKSQGFKVTQRIPSHVIPNSYNTSYLKTKKDKSSHLL